MKLNFALSLIALLAAATNSLAGFQITVKVGSDVRTIGDNLAGDENPLSGVIQIANLNDVGFGSTKYNWSSIYATWGVNNLGIDGNFYGLDVSVASIKEVTAGSTANGTVVSIYGSVNDLASLIGEPAAVSANIQVKANSGTTGSNRYTAAYDGRYDSANQLTTSPAGTVLLSGSAIRSSTTTYTRFIDDGTPLNVSPFSSSAFSLGIGMSATTAWQTSAPTTPYDYNFGGTLNLQQVPEPSHTALPVGLAAGFLGLRRRRVTR